VVNEILRQSNWMILFHVMKKVLNPFIIIYFSVLANLKHIKMAKGMNSKKAEKKEPTKTPKEKKEEKREKKKAGYQ
jgi:hypothetical protein